MTSNRNGGTEPTVTAANTILSHLKNNTTGKQIELLARLYGDSHRPRDENVASKRCQSLYEQRIQHITTLPAERKLGAIAATAAEFRVNEGIVSEAVSIQYHQCNVPRQPHCQQWAPGTLLSVNTSLMITRWVVRSAHYYGDHDVDEETGYLWLPPGVVPTSYRWPVEGCPVICLLSIKDETRRTALSNVLSEYGAQSIDVRLQAVQP